MNEVEKKPKLFTDFEPTTQQQWQQQIEKDLRGASYDTLRWHPYENITVEPVYTRTDTEELPYTHALPGTPPYVRSRKTSQNNWLNIPAYQAEENGHKAIDRAAAAVANGADGVHFIVADTTAFDIHYLVRQLDLNKLYVAYTFNERPYTFFKRFHEILHENGISPNGLKGFIHNKNFAYDATAVAELSELLDLTKFASGFYGLTINGSYFAEKGADAIQEIAFTLSQAVALVDDLTDEGATLESVLRNMQFKVSVGTNYFFEIAKLRALRLLWSAIVQAYEAEPAMAALLRIHASTSRWSQTTFDPYVNLLRHTTEAMAAVIGGADSLTIEPFDSTFRQNNAFSERIARNISLILKEEAYLGKAVDPAAGSYYLESLTHQLAEKAWDLFKEVEQEGGFTEALRKGTIDNYISHVSKQKFANIAAGTDVLVGTNKFPNKQEKTEFDPVELMRSPDFDGNRGAYPFEIMRLAALAHYQSRKRQPQAVIVLFAPAAQHAHASFAREFFQCSGFDTQMLEASSVEEALQHLNSNNPDVVVMAASDEQFADFATEFTDQYRKQSSQPALVLAAHPQDMIEEMRQQGFDGYIFKGCETDSIISHLQKALLN